MFASMSYIRVTLLNISSKLGAETSGSPETEISLNDAASINNSYENKTFSMLRLC